MKKLLISSIVLLSVISSADAQVAFGVKLGANIFTFTGSDADDEGKKSRVGLAVGALANIPVHETFSVQPELFLSQEGAVFKDDDYKETETLNYLNVPVLAQYNSAGGFFLHTGPQIGFLLSAKQKYKDGEEEETDDIKDDFKSTNFSWVVGAGFRHESGFGVGARYNLGLSNIIDYEEVNLKSSGFNIGVFYIFGSAGTSARRR